MKSVQIQKITENIEDIQIVDAPTPKPGPGPGQVSIRVLYAAVNPSDFNFIRGDYENALKRIIWNTQSQQLCYDPARNNHFPSFPYSLGVEGVGIVEACGSGLLAKRLKGKRVAFTSGPPHGAWQEHTIVEAKKAVPLPDTLSDEQGAMYMVNPISSYVMVKEVLKVKPNSWLLLSAGGSALAKSVLRMSKVLGFKTIHIVRSNTNTAELKRLGAEVIIETDTQDIVSEVHAATNGRGVEYAMDCIGGKTAEQMIRCLTLNGHLVAYGTLGNEPVSLPYRDMMMPTSRLTGFFVSNWIAQQSIFKMLSVIRGVAKLSKLGVFETPVEAIYDIDDVKEALKASIETGRTGKILLKIGA